MQKTGKLVRGELTRARPSLIPTENHSSGNRHAREKEHRVRNVTRENVCRRKIYHPWRDCLSVTKAENMNGIKMRLLEGRKKAPSPCTSWFPQSLPHETLSHETCKILMKENSDVLWDPVELRQ